MHPCCRLRPDQATLVVHGGINRVMGEKDTLAKLQTLFEQALERLAADRRAFLEVACGDDPALLDEVLPLDADDPANGTLAGAAAGSLGEEFDPDFRQPARRQPAGPLHACCDALAPAAWAPCSSAERSDGAFERQVAVKVVRRGAWIAQTVVQRFVAERRSCPGSIIPTSPALLDGGVTPDGRPLPRHGVCRWPAHHRIL